MTTTTNYALTKPVVGGDADAWGGYLNTNMDAIDAALTGIAASLINGLTLSTAGSSATFGIAAGNAGDSSGRLMALASAYTKTTSTWAVGTGSGALDTGAIANSTWYHVWVIKRVDTGVVDILISTAASAPTMPTNYTLKRRIGAMLTNGSNQWVKFLQYGDEFLWDGGVNSDDLSTTTLSTTPTLFALTVPSGVKVTALVRGRFFNASSSFLLASSPDEGTVVVDTPSGNVTATNTGGATSTGFIGAVRTNVSKQIYLTASAASSTVHGGAYGWIDPRGKF